MTISFGVDIGGTKISAAYIVGEEVIASSKRPYSPQSVIADICDLYNELTAGRDKPNQVGICCAGLVEPDSGIVRFAGNLNLTDFPLAKLVEESIGVNVLIENDARAALWGEFTMANGSLGNNIAGLILGTGVGGGLILNSKLIQGKNGFAGELGHLPVSNSKRLCACGLVGCLESIAGGRSFEAYFEEKTGLKHTGEEIAHLAREGNSAAQLAFADLGQAIGEVIAQVDTALDLDAVVIGGGFGATMPLWLPAAQQGYEGALVGASNRKKTLILQGKQGQLAQLIGAASLR